MRRNKQPDIRLRMAAAVTYCDSQRGFDNPCNRRREMFAFLSIMHPELKLEQRLRLANNAYREAEIEQSGK